MSLFFFKQTQKKQRYRFSLIANEVKSAENIPYKTTLIAFVNCIIVSNGEVKDRVAVRNEFIGEVDTFSTVILCLQVKHEMLHIFFCYPFLSNILSIIYHNIHRDVCLVTYYNLTLNFYSLKNLLCLI